VARLLSMVAFEDGVDHVHEGGLDGFGAFRSGRWDGSASRRGVGTPFDHASVEVAKKIFLLEGGGNRSGVR